MAAEHVQALGERIRLRREELGMTQDEVARKMKGSVDGQRISKWERGENRPRDESLEDLARVLETTAVALLAPAPDKAQTPDLSKQQPLEVLADRLDAIERALQEAREERDQHAQTIQRMLDEQAKRLKRQDDILDKIETAVANEQRATQDAQVAARDLRELLKVLGVAIPALAGASQPTVEAPEQPAK